MLENKSVGVVALILMLVIGFFVCGLGVLCFLDIGMGQGGVVLLFFGLGIGLMLLGVFFYRLNGRNRICFDENRVIRYRVLGAPVEIAWAEVTAYGCDPRRTFIAAMDGRKITADSTFSGLPEFVEMIQRKVAGRSAAAVSPGAPAVPASKRSNSKK